MHLETSAYVLRPTQRSDASALISVYFNITGKLRTESEFVWEWFDAPLGANDSFVIISKQTQEVVGHHGLVKIPLAIGGKKLLAGRTESSMLLPEYRRSINYAMIETHLLNTAFENYDMIITTAGKKAQYAVRMRLGYKDFGPWTIDKRNGGARYYFRKSLSKIASRLNKSEWRDEVSENAIINKLIALQPISVIAPNEIPENISRRLTANNGGLIFCLPDPKFLKWKMEKPNSSKHLLLFNEPSEPFIALLSFQNRIGSVCDVRVEALFCNSTNRAVTTISHYFNNIGEFRIIYRNLYCGSHDENDKAQQVDLRLIENMPARLLVLQRLEGNNPIKVDGMATQV